jgi:hypothetical protein
MIRPSLLFLLTCGAPALAAQATGPALAIHGLEPGISQSQLQERVAQLGGRLRCRRSVADRRLAECVASIARAPDHHLWAMRASTVNGTTAILLLSASLETTDVEQLRDRWIDALGRPNRRSEPGLESYEWSRGGRTLRLTVHQGNDGRRDVSVNVVQTAALATLGQAQ